MLLKKVQMHCGSPDKKDFGGYLAGYEQTLKKKEISCATDPKTIFGFKPFYHQGMLWQLSLFIAALC